jgi:O-antigen/teichoic acid export membrane protein
MLVWKRNFSMKIAVAQAVQIIAPYMLAVSGPLVLSATQFVLSVVLVHLMSPKEFGTFSFLMVTSQFLMSFSGAFLCAPLPVVMARAGKTGDAANVGCLFGVNVIIGLLVFIVLTALSAALGIEIVPAALFGGFASLTMLRWFGRAYVYAIGLPQRAALSDIVSGVVLGVGIGLIAWQRSASPLFAYGFLMLSAAGGLLAFGPRHLAEQLRLPRLEELSRYGAVWKEHSSWSLLGLVTTEATGNAHAYFVTLISGAVAFAALAASALLIRPAIILMNALGEFERPRLARLVAQQRWSDVDRTLSLFRFILMSGWFATLGLGVIVAYFAPSLLFSKDYDLLYVQKAFVLWLAIMGLRLVRTPESILLQAAGQFRVLAFSSVYSSVISIILVVVMVWAVGPLYSMVGVLAGEAIFTLAVWRVARAWRWKGRQASPHVQLP